MDDGTRVTQNFPHMYDIYITMDISWKIVDKGWIKCSINGDVDSKIHKPTYGGVIVDEFGA